jgi:pimeloyl-ACP methyl ester carboxylesterase
VRLQYIDRGEGQPVVLLHGNGSMIQELALSGLVDRLAQDYRVIAFDRPGFGYSARPRDRSWGPAAQAELLLTALQRLGLGRQRPVVVAHSWGALVALAMALGATEQPAGALERRQEIAGLVLISGYYFPTFRSDVPFFGAPAIPVFGDALRYTLSPVIGRLLAPGIIAKLFAPAPVPPAFAAFPVELALRPWQIRAAAADTAAMVPAAALLSPLYSELTLPVEIIAGAEDRIVDPGRHARRLHHMLPQSRLHLVEGAGHMVHHQAVGDVVRAVAAVGSTNL